MDKTKFFNLSDITSRIQQILQPHIEKLFWVKAEISSGRERGGSFYCDLVESDEKGKIVAQVRCTIWNRDLSNIRKQFKGCDLNLKLDDGTVVGFQCSLQFSSQYGLSLKVIDADPAFALGELELKKREILNRLTKEGLLTPNKQLFVPMLPQKIGVVTSKGSAAYNDFLKTLTSSQFGFKIYIADANVQGTHAEQSIVHALDTLEKISPELVIIIRGGGSKTDLSYLDNEVIARRIASYKLPVWTGIGHEIDMSILDHVSNKSFKTPTAVAEEILARFVDMQRHVEEAKNRFKSTWSYRFDVDKKWMNDAKTGIRQGTRKLLDTTKGNLKDFANQLSSKVIKRLTNEKTRISVSKKILGTAPLNLTEMVKDRLHNKIINFRNSCTRQIYDKTKDLITIRKRFHIDRYSQLMYQEKNNIESIKELLMAKIFNELKTYKKDVIHFKTRFKKEIIMTRIQNEMINIHTKNATLKASDPKTSLKRGFSLAYNADGELVKSINQLNLQDILKTEISDGLVLSTISEIERK